MARRVWAVLAVLIVLAVAIGARVLGTGSMVLPDGGVRPVSSDSHYYLRRITATYREFPTVPDSDSGLGCPDAVVPPWPGGVERVAAGLAHMMLPADAPNREVERFSAWLPVASGALTALAVLALGWAWFGPGVGFLAGLLLALLPLQIGYTAFGFVDHHMLLGLWVASLAWFIDRLLHKPEKKQVFQLSVALAIGQALMTEGWIVELVIVPAALCSAATMLPPGDERKAALRGLVIAVGLAAVLTVPVILQAPYFAHNLVAAHALSRFTLWLLAGFSAALACGLALVGPQADRRAKALAAAALAAAAFVALAAGTDPAMRAAFSALLDFSGRAGMVATIQESKPLWRQPWPQPLFILGATVVLLPILPISFVGLPPIRRNWLIWLYAATAALALMQTRFGLVFVVPYVLAWSRVLTLRAPRFTKSLAAFAALGALTLVPPLWQAERWSPHEESTWRMLVWMRDHVPPPASAGQRCVLAPWDVGHKVLHVTGHPVIACNFTELNERDALRDSLGFFLANDFSQVEPLLHRRQVRWVWTMATSWQVLAANAEEINLRPPTVPVALNYLGTRLLLDAGSGRIDGGNLREATGTLRRIHLAVLELPSLWHGKVAGPVRESALFERVVGARLVGRGQPGALVTAVLRIKHPGAPAFAFQQVGRVAVDGSFALRVPYASEPMPFGITAGGPWRVQVGDRIAQVPVFERAVQVGADVPVL